MAGALFVFGEARQAVIEEGFLVLKTPLGMTWSGMREPIQILGRERKKK
jgi:hypothetical protein